MSSFKNGISLFRTCTARRSVPSSIAYVSHRMSSSHSAAHKRHADESFGYPKPQWFSNMHKAIQEHINTPNGRPEGVKGAEELLRQTNQHWLGLVAGREGFLTDYSHRGVDRKPIFWGDMDPMQGHLNNVMYNRYAEWARVSFFHQLAQESDDESKRELWDDLITPRGLGLILKSIKTEFKFPMKFPDSVTALYKISQPLTYESHDLHFEVWIMSEDHRRLAARCLEEVTVYDYNKGKKATLEPFMVDKLNELWELQEASKKKYTDMAHKVATQLDAIQEYA